MRREMYLNRATGDVWATGGPIEGSAALIGRVSIIRSGPATALLWRHAETVITIDTDDHDAAWQEMAWAMHDKYGALVGFTDQGAIP